METKLPSEFDTVILIKGRGLLAEERLTEFLGRFEHDIITIGSKDRGFTLEDVERSLNQEGLGKVLLYINAHGNYDEESHFIGASAVDEDQQVLYVRDIIESTNKFIPTNYDVINVSCFSGGMLDGSVDLSKINRVFTAASADKMGLSPNRIEVYENFGNQEFSFDSYVIQSFHENRSNTGYQLYDNGRIFDGDHPEVYQATHAFEGFLQDAAKRYSLNITKIKANYHKFSNFTPIHYDTDQEKVDGRTVQSIIDVAFDGPITDDSREAYLLKQAFGDRCINPKAISSDGDEDSVSTMEEFVELVMADLADYPKSSVLKNFIMSGSIECDNAFPYDFEGFVELSYLYFKFISGEDTQCPFISE